METKEYDSLLLIMKTNNENQAKLISANHATSMGFLKSLNNQLNEFKLTTKESLTKAELYNITQNGRMANLTIQVRDLENESKKRKLTCGAAVDVLTKAAADKLIEEKENLKEKKGRKLSKKQWIALFSISAIMAGCTLVGTTLAIINFLQP